MPYILSEMAEFIGTITLDHERRRNALSKPLKKSPRRDAIG